jgi:hypothetical protein
LCCKDPSVSSMSDVLIGRMSAKFKHLWMGENMRLMSIVHNWSAVCDTDTYYNMLLSDMTRSTTCRGSQVH